MISNNSPGNDAPASYRKKYIKQGTPANWEDVSADAIRHAIAQVGSIGGAIRLGYTRDGGAFAIGVYGVENEPFTDYLKPSDDVAAYLDELSDEVLRLQANHNDQLVAVKQGKAKPGAR